MKMIAFCDIAACNPVEVEGRTASIIRAINEFIALMMEAVHTSATSVY
jgi:hypothetical protein